MGRRRRQGLTAAGSALIGVALALGVSSPPASAQQAVGPLTIGAAMTGETDGVRATAASSWDGDGATITLRVTNPTDSPVSLEVPYGAMFAAGDESQQTIVTAGPSSSDAAAVARSGATPTITAPPGESMHQLLAFCGQEFDHSPSWPVPVSYRGVAKDPLPHVLQTIQARQADPDAAQHAVWWLTDDPTMPVGDPDVAALLEGVDTAGFAAAPYKVVPDDSYRPKWAGGGSAIGRLGGTGAAPPLGAAVAVLLLAAAVGLLVFFGARRRPSSVTVRADDRPTGGAAPGWYGDPAAPGLRYWDGCGWTEHARRG